MHLLFCVKYCVQHLSDAVLEFIALTQLFEINKTSNINTTFSSSHVCYVAEWLRSESIPREFHAGSDDRVLLLLHAVASFYCRSLQLFTAIFIQLFLLAQVQQKSCSSAPYNRVVGEAAKVICNRYRLVFGAAKLIV